MKGKWMCLKGDKRRVDWGIEVRKKAHKIRSKINDRRKFYAGMFQTITNFFF
jgi:hypothetical protein